MSATVTIAHLSDVHLAPLSGFSPNHWNAKRFLGYANWRLKRHKSHLRSVIDRLVDDLKSQRWDHIAVTGDLVNIGLPREYEGALRWLHALGSPDQVSVVPGNHDIYAKLRNDPGVARWAAYMRSDGFGRELAPGEGPRFPFVRRIGHVALVGLNSAVVTPPGVASGELGPAQIEEAARLLRELARMGLFRLVLIHHPPVAAQVSALRALRDAPQFEAALAREGAELVIHGHNHRDEICWRTGNGKPLPIVGIASGSIGRFNRHEPLARYNIYQIRNENGRWRIEMVGRGIRTPEGPVVEVERRALAPMQTAA